MELDDFKRKHEVRKPDSPDIEADQKVRVDDLVNQFREYQKKKRKHSFLMIFINTLLALIYLRYAILQSGLTAIGYYLLGFGVIAGVIFLFFRYKSLSPETYSLPVSKFLEKAEKKITYFSIIDYLIIVPVLIVLGTGGGLVFTGSLLKYTDNSLLLIVIWVCLFITFCVFGFFAGRKSWQKEYGKFFLKISEMKNQYYVKEE